MSKTLAEWFKRVSVVCLSFILILSFGLPKDHAQASPLKKGDQSGKRQMEYLDRGLVAVKVDNGVFLSWRYLGTDPATGIGFNVYRDGKKINSKLITESTNYLDKKGSADSHYYVRVVINGKSKEKSKKVSVWNKNYLAIPLQKPEGGTTPDGVHYTYSANDASVGDLDGDGQYEFVVEWYPSNAKDNSQDGYTGNVYMDAYELGGKQLWRIDLGHNLRAGAHYNPFLVYDFDGDGKAEVVFRTADGTVDGKGKTIGDPNADYRNETGRILSGPEYLTVFNGKTGKALSTIDYAPARGNVTDWGDDYGNRVDRFLAGVAYLDGVHPSIIMSRGYYAKTMLVAYNWRNNKLTKLWTFDSTDPGNGAYAGQGFHNLSFADVDNDGKDEIFYGAMALDDDGTGLYSTGLGHGDAIHVGDLNPNHPGLEVFNVHEDKSSPYGAEIHDAATGEILWGTYTGKDTGRGLAADIDPRYDGTELWAASGVGLHTVTGEKISDTAPASINNAIWWDGDLLRELLDHNWDDSIGAGVGTISKWDYENNQTVNLLTADGTLSNNGTKGNPSLQADILGDWREEAVWRNTDSTELRIYTTTDLTQYRILTLMHDPMYREAIAWQNVGYNQPPYTSFYLGAGMDMPAQPNIYTTKHSNGK